MSCSKKWKQYSFSNNNNFSNTFFPSTITEWNKLNLTTRNSTSFDIFKYRLLQFIKPLESSVYTCYNPMRIKYLKRLRIVFSHLRYYEFKHSFLDIVDPICSCSSAIENTAYYFLQYAKLLTVWNTFLNVIVTVDRFIIDQHKIKIIKTFFYGKPTYSVNYSKLILNTSIRYILEPKKFDGPIFF